MDDAAFIDLSAWLTRAGLAGTSETDILCGFCERCVAAGLPLGRAQAHIDTLHPVHEGRYSAGAMVLTNPLCMNMVALARKGLPRPVSIQEMSR